MTAVPVQPAHPADLPPDSRSPAIAVYQLAKDYRTGFWLNQHIHSLQGIDLQVAQGETFGLLGPNGAGKTTLLKLLLGLSRPSAGGGTVLGRPLGDRTVRGRVGYLPENAYFYDHLTGWEYLDYAGKLLGLASRQRQQQIGELLDWVDLSPKTAREKLMREYSKGMLQRVGVAQALLKDPEIVFFDEPMSGLDPLGRYQIREIILALKRRGKTIFFNSHILSDVELVCDRVAILHQGRLLCEGAIDELLGSASSYRIEGIGGAPEVLAHWVLDLERQGGDRWSGRLVGTPEAAWTAISAAGGQVLGVALARPSLETFFVQTLRAASLGDRADQPIN